MSEKACPPALEITFRQPLPVGSPTRKRCFMDKTAVGSTLTWPSESTLPPGYHHYRHIITCLADQFQKPSELFQELITCVKSLLAMSLGIFKAIPVSLGKPCGRGEAKGGIMGSTSKIELGEPGRRSMRRLASTRRERAPTWL